MATEREDCIDGIAKKTGRSRKQVADDLDELLDRADQARAAGKSPREALSNAGSDMLDEMGEVASVYKRAAQIDGLNRAQRHRWYQARMSEGHDPALVMEAKMVGVNTPFDRSRKSAEATHGLLTEKYAGNFGLDLERAGLDRLFGSRSIEDKWTDELAELNRTKGGRPGVTKDPQALEIAQLIHKWQKVSMQEINDAGGWVRSYSGYVTRTGHEPDLVRTGGRSQWRNGLEQDAARSRWVSFIMKHADLPRTFGSGDLSEILPEMWGKLARGEHFEIKALDDDEMGAVPYANVARQASAHREIHWKSAADWRAYIAEFGPHNPTSQVMHSFDVAARRVALLQHFGTKPREEFENDIAYLRRTLQGDPAKFDAFTRKEPLLRNLYNQLDFSANKPANRIWANAVAGTMALNRWSKLGRVVFTHIASLITKADAGRYIGLSLGERYGSMLSGFFRGTSDSDRRIAAELTLAGAHARIGRMIQRYDVADQAPGVMSKIDQVYFKLAGLHAAVDNQRGDFETITARHYGMQRDKPWADIDARERRVLSLYGINEPEWKALRTVEWSDIGGATHLMPPDARKIEDGAMRSMLRERGGIGSRSITDESIRKAREDLADTIHALYYDQARYAIFEPSARVRARMFGGTQQSSPNLYKALQLLFQFRVWPAEMIARTWGRMIYGGESNMQKVAAVTELVVASAVFGTLAEALREVVQGQDPRGRMASAPMSYVMRGMLRSGAATIAGDYLFGEFDRHGHSILGSLAGPTYGQAENVINLRNEFLDGLTKGKWAQFAAGSLHELRGNIPFVDMWWTFKAFDYLVTYRLLDWLNPGYLRRYEQKQKRERGIDYWLRPSAVA